MSNEQLQVKKCVLVLLISRVKMNLTNTTLQQNNAQTQVQDWQKSLNKKGDPVERKASDCSFGCRHHALTNMQPVELKDIMHYCGKELPLHNVKCSNPGCKQGKLSVTTETKNGKKKTNISWRKDSDGSHVRCCICTSSARCTSAHCNVCAEDIMSKENGGRRSTRSAGRVD